MVKVKNKRNNASKLQSKKKEGKTKLNPFEVHINKEKLKVLNRKQKHDRGVPGISRSKAISKVNIRKRKNTLLQEYKVHKKSNKFTDMRIGERDPTMPEEHRILARYTAEKVKSHNRKSIFNLADDEILTHKGQVLTEIEKFENNASDDDDDEDGNNLEANFVKEAHFGGGLFHKVNSDGAKSHKDLINQLILESKKRKNERLKIKEQTLELTEKLDTEWKDLLPLVSASRKKPEPETGVKATKSDDYDKVMRELKFEVRGNPSDRLKSEEEIQKKEKEELERFEKERAKRMHGGDDLDDNFTIEDVNDEDEQESEHSDDDSIEDGEEIMSMEEDAKSENSNADGEESDNLIEEEENNKNDDDNDDNISLSDLKADDSSSSEDEQEEKENDDDDNISLSDLKANDSSSSEDEDEEETNNISSLEDKKEEKAAATLEIKKTGREMCNTQKNEKLSVEVTFPDCYSTLEGTFEYMKPEKLGILLPKLIQLIAGNKEKSNTLFAYIGQYIDSSLCTFKKLAYLLPYIFELAKVNPDRAYATVRLSVKEKQMEYRKKPKQYPPFPVLLLLKAISALFPTSDFRHGVVTPTMVFISQILTRCCVRTGRDISYGLFLVTLVLEYTALSKRFLPAAVNFLDGIIHMAIPKTGVRLIKITRPFKKTSTLLVLQENMTDFTGDLFLQETDLRNVKETNPIFQISAISLAVKLLNEMVLDFKDLPSRCEVFERTLSFLRQLPLNYYPVTVQNDIQALIANLESNIADRKLDLITAPKKKPKLLRQYEPNIEKVYDGKKHKGKSREKMEQDKMLHKIKRETKGAMREIRRDKSFLGRVQINQRIQSDVERREKVKRIYAEAASQQAELNSLDRKRKKR